MKKWQQTPSVHVHIPNLKAFLSWKNIKNIFLTKIICCRYVTNCTFNMFLSQCYRFQTLILINLITTNKSLNYYYRCWVKVVVLFLITTVTQLSIDWVVRQGVVSTVQFVILICPDIHRKITKKKLTAK